MDSQADSLDALFNDGKVASGVAGEFGVRLISIRQYNARLSVPLLIRIVYILGARTTEVGIKAAFTRCVLDINMTES